MAESDERQRYDRVVLMSVWDGMIGPSSHTDEAVAMKCCNCRALVQPGDEQAHDTWHTRVADGIRSARRGR